MSKPTKAALPRGLRNFNPGNIRHGQPWQGRAEVQLDPDFVTFQSYAWGIRAMARTLLTYQDPHGLATIRAIIGRWAPPNENDTEAYIQAVAHKIGVGPDEPVSVHDYPVMRALVEAITQHENGRVAPITAAEFDQGLTFAGVPPDRPKPLMLTRTGIGSSIATAGTAAGAVVDRLKDSDVQQAVTTTVPVAGPSAPETALETVQQAQEAVSYTLGLWQWAGIACAVLALLGVGLVLYGKWDRRRKGLT